MGPSNALSSIVCRRLSYKFRTLNAINGLNVSSFNWVKWFFERYRNRSELKCCNHDSFKDSIKLSSKWRTLNRVNPENAPLSILLILFFVRWSSINECSPWNVCSFNVFKMFLLRSKLWRSNGPLNVSFEWREAIKLLLRFRFINFDCWMNCSRPRCVKLLLLKSSSSSWNEKRRFYYSNHFYK